jgi:hypothetical protein
LQLEGIAANLSKPVELGRINVTPASKTADNSAFAK